MRTYLPAIVSLFLFFSCEKSTPAATGPVITGLDCSSLSFSATPTAGISFNGTITVSYSGGNGKTYTAGSATLSTGVTGLTVSLQSGTLANGSGNLVFAVTGTATGPGNAGFSISFGNKSCSVILPVAENNSFEQYGTPFANVPDRKDAIIYQVNMRVFSTAGNFQGVIDRLDSIKAMGVNVIYLMPIYPVGVANAFNSPYCVRDYKTVNSEFGSLTDLRALVDGAHSRNMSVLLDWVANHTSWDHTWISTHNDWYQKNTAGAIISPPGMGWNDVAQLDFTNTAMRLEMIRNLKYWVYTANIDGFRFDYADGPPFSFWKQAVDSLRLINTHKLLLLAEGSRSDHYAAGFDYTFGFNFYGGLRGVFGNGLPATNFDVLNNLEFSGATNGQQVVRYTTNHDINGSDGTPQELYGGLTGSMSAFIAASLMKGVPMIYNGQEVGTPYRLTFPFTSADINWTLNPDLKAEYKRILAFRNSSAAIRGGTLASFSSADILAFTRELGTEKVFILSNVRNSSMTYTVPAALAGTSWTNVITGALVSVGVTITLPAYSYLLLKN